jgi:hypothetical protein
VGYNTGYIMIYFQIFMKYRNMIFNLFFEVRSLVLMCTKSLSGNNDDSWERPESRQLKLNVDASYYHEDDVGAMGAILHEYTMSFIAATRRPISHVFSVAMAEAMAMKEGLELPTSMGCNIIVAESDSSETIEACTGETRWWNEASPIYEDIVDMATTIGILKVVRGKKTR